MGDVAIVAYRPKPGQEDALLELTREHVPILRGEGPATQMPPIAMLADDGTVVEVFEWAPGAMERAHHNPVVRAMWNRYAAVCEYVPLHTLAEARQLFASFRRLDLTP